MNRIVLETNNNHVNCKDTILKGLRAFSFPPLAALKSLCHECFSIPPLAALIKEIVSRMFFLRFFGNQLVLLKVTKRYFSPKKVTNRYFLYEKVKNHFYLHKQV